MGRELIFQTIFETLLSVGYPAIFAKNSRTGGLSRLGHALYKISYRKTDVTG
jgi:hypothetical protein